MPLAGESSVLDIRFEAPSAHWAAAFLRLPLEAVQPDVTRRAAQMTSAGVAHTAPVTLRDLDRPAAVLTRTQWAIASRVDGTLSPRDLARQSGLSLYETVTSLGALLRRGLCGPGLAEPAVTVRPSHDTLLTSIPPASAPATPLPPDTLSRLITPTAAPAPRPPDPLAQPRAAQLAAATAVPPVRPAPDQTSAADATAASPDVPAARASWTDPSTPATRTPWASSANSPASSGSGLQAIYATLANGASSAPRDTSGSPAERRPFAPAATSTPVTPSTPPSARVGSGATPGAPVPAVNPAPVDVPSAASSAPGSPSYPHRRPARRPWPESDAPVPPATLASHPPNGQDPAGQTRASHAPAAPDPGAKPPASVWAEPAGAHRAARPARGAHREDRPSHPEGARYQADEPSAAETAEPPVSLPPRRRPTGLPQRQPRRRPGGGLYPDPRSGVATDPRPYTAAEPEPPNGFESGPQPATEPIPVAAEGWPQRSSFDRPAEPAHIPGHPSAPLPVRPPIPVRSTRPPGSAGNGGGAESEDFAPAAPDLLRRVLDGLRRLA